MAIPANLLSASVGLGGSNRNPDVQLVQRLLNAVPQLKGGPLQLLAVDGACGPKTCGAISRFQSMNLGFSDGRIDVGGKTLAALLSLLEILGVLGQLLGVPGGAAPPAPTPGIPGASIPGSNAGLSALRADIVKWALLASKGPYGEVGAGAANGIVSDRDTAMETLSWGGKQTVRRGWKNLKEIFDVAVAGWTEQHWKAPGYLDGVKIPGKRIPQPGTSGISWCGIFATWCWIKAGKQTKWQLGLGPSNAARIAGNQGIQPGDICVQSGKTVHHFVAVEINGDQIQSVNGNSDYQSILLKPATRGSVIYYYRPD